eukprot:g67604.t1
MSAWSEIRALADKEHTSFVQYLRSGQDLMPISTFLESFSGLLAATVGSCGIVASNVLGSMVPDAAAGLIMSSFVGVVSSFLLSRSSSQLLGATLPLSLVDKITLDLQTDPVVVAVYDVKTEVMGVVTDT